MPTLKPSKPLPFAQAGALLACAGLLLCLAACDSRNPAPAEATPATGAPAMHPSWDADGDGINDCEKDGSCDHTTDYTQPRPAP